MATQVGRVETLFLHDDGKDVQAVVTRGGERLLRAILELKETDAGPRPGKFRVKRGSREDPRDPDEFVEIARRAERIRISEQTSQRSRDRLREMLDGYQLEALVVRTCRYCASGGEYSPITAETAVQSGRDSICPSCASAELEREVAHAGGLTSAAKDRLEELMIEVGDLDRVVDLLSGELDPDLTRFDTISATVGDVDPVAVADLDLQPTMREITEARFESLLPVQSRAVAAGLIRHPQPT